MNEFLKSLAEAVADKLWLAPVIAIVSGVLTSLMPCSLSTIPLVIGFVGGQDLPQNGKSSRRALLLSILFAVGSTVTFCILGMLASALGGLLERAETVLHFAMSILLVLMALQMWEVIRIIPSGNSVLAKSRLTGGVGAFISGITFEVELTIYSSSLTYIENGVNYEVPVSVNNSVFEVAPRLGDVNLDGSVTIADALEVMRHAIEVLTLEGASLDAADMNGDGVIGLPDAILIARRAMGL